IAVHILQLLACFCVDTLVWELYTSLIRTGDFMPHAKSPGTAQTVSALRVRTHFGKMLRRLETEGHSLVIEKRGTPRAILLSIRDSVRLAAPDPEVLTLLGIESKRRGTASLTSRQIDRIIASARSRRTSRRR